MPSAFVTQPDVWQLEEKLLQGFVAEYSVLHLNPVGTENSKHRGHIFIESFVPFDMDAVFFYLYPVYLL